MPSSKSFDKRLDQWMLDQFYRQDFPKNKFIGKDRFLDLLISEYKKSVGGVVPEHELWEKVKL